jgi:methionyl-tRNA formyltransferase
MSTAPHHPPLRVVTFNVYPQAYAIVCQWAEQGGHQIELVVTTPGSKVRQTPSYQAVLSSAAPTKDVLVTTRLRKVAQPLISALQPDLIISFSFPHRIPPEICAIPRYGAVNLHPTVLPAYRGPNPLRPIYEGYPLLGATLHWTTAAFDTGNILAQHTMPLPVNITPEAVRALWPPLRLGALTEGIARAVAGDAGTAQDHRQATYAGFFTEEESWLTPADTQQVMQRKCTALSFALSTGAKLRLGDQVYLVTRVDPLDAAQVAAPGTIIEQTDRGLTLQVADGCVQIQATPVAIAG